MKKADKIKGISAKMVQCADGALYGETLTALALAASAVIVQAVGNKEDRADMALLVFTETVADFIKGQTR